MNDTLSLGVCFILRLRKFVIGFLIKEDFSATLNDTKKHHLHVDHFKSDLRKQST